MQAIELTDYPFVPESERKKAKKNQITFYLSTLDFDQDTYIENLISNQTPDGDLTLPILSMGIKRVENFKGRNGKPINVERDLKSDTTYPGDIKPLTSAFLSKISNLERSRLNLQIRYGKEISEKEAKN